MYGFRRQYSVSSEALINYISFNKMIAKAPQDEIHFSHIKSGQILRKVVSDVTSEIDKLGKDLETIPKIDEVTEVECDCCGLHEECTQDYILKVKDSYSGRWICGLCSEAVKEKLNREQTAIEEALSTHRSFCQESRKNPKLSFTSTMRELARRSFDNRKNNPSSSSIARSTSCVPRFSFSK